MKLQTLNHISGRRVNRAASHSDGWPSAASQIVRVFEDDKEQTPI
jgi:hypothetical protein